MGANAATEEALFLSVGAGKLLVRYDGCGNAGNVGGGTSATEALAHHGDGDGFGVVNRRAAFLEAHTRLQEAGGAVALAARTTVPPLW